MKDLILKFIFLFVKNWNLIVSLTKRDIASKYKGSLIGVLWSFIFPLLMLTVYTFVFSVVFQARWSGGEGSKTEFALVLFCGLIFFNLFSDCISRAPTLITSNVNYVKKVVFPIEILPIVSLLSSFFHFVISLIVWIIFYIIFFGVPHATFILVPLIFIPFAMMVLGLSWFLSSLSVYVRDVTQIVGVAVMVLMYLSPIFYPVSMLPESYQVFMKLSPLTFIVESARDLMIFGNGLNIFEFFLYTAISLLTMVFGYIWFLITKKGFADVI